MTGSVLVLLVYLGCASGGKDVETQLEGGRFRIEDERGFERELGPAEIAYQSAMQFLASGNYEGAIQQLQQATSIKSTYLEAWSQLGKIQTKVKNFETGIQAFERALELSPGDEALIASIGYNYLYLEDWDKAEEYYGKLIENDTLNYEGNVHLGFIYQKRGDIDNAIKFYKLALATKSSDATTMGTLASLYDKKGEEGKKIEYLKMAIEAAPDVYKFKTQLGNVYMNKKDYESAIPIYEGLVIKFPDMAAYHQNLGLALSQTDRKAEAPAELEKAIELKEDEPLIYVYLSQFYNDLGQQQKSIDTVKRGLNFAAGSGQEPPLYYQWGVALSKLKKFDEAIAKFEKVIGYNNPQWTGYARKQIDRQVKLKKRAEAIKQKEQYE